MAKFSALGLALMAGILTAAPAGAVRDMSSPSGTVGLFGAAPVIAPEHSRHVRRPTDAKTIEGAVAPKSVNWLMMLVGFGLLGTLNRRSNSDLLRDEMVL